MGKPSMSVHTTATLLSFRKKQKNKSINNSESKRKKTNPDPANTSAPISLKVDTVKVCEREPQEMYHPEDTLLHFRSYSLFLRKPICPASTSRWPASHSPSASISNESKAEGATRDVGWALTLSGHSQGVSAVTEPGNFVWDFPCQC